MEQIIAESAVRGTGSGGPFKSLAPGLSREFLASVRARVPFRVCEGCGQSIGAARLTLHPAASSCAWCASALRPPQ